MSMLDADISQARAAAMRLLPRYHAHPEHVHFVLTTMAFQLGAGGLAEFKKTLAFVDARNYKAAADEMLRSRWAEQTPGRAERLAAIMRGP